MKLRTLNSPKEISKKSLLNIKKKEDMYTGFLLFVVCLSIYNSNYTYIDRNNFYSGTLN